MSYGGRRRRTSGGFKIRLLIAVAMVGYALFSYFSMGQVNPITGEKQRVALNPEEEVRMGMAAAPEMAQQHGGLHPDPKDQQLVDQVGGRLVNMLEQRLTQIGRNNPYNFEFHLLRDPQSINAFALPGGQIFITDALYSKLQTEAQLAGVLGHEVGHVIARHGNQRMAKQKLTQGLTGAAGVAGGGYNSASMAKAIGNMINMKYGREAELESDKWGVMLCTESGYDPRAMIGVMDILEASSGPSRQPEMMSTHPKPANRKKYIQDVITEVFPQGLPSGLRP